MADDAKGNEAPLEPHLFQAGGDAKSAEAKLLGLLSDADLDAKVMKAAGPTEEEGEPAIEKAAPALGEDEQEEEVVDEDDAPLGDEHEDEGDGSDEEWEYVDEEGNVIEDPGEVETYTVMVDGKERQATLEELTQSYSFRAHNTQKSQELAEQRKAVEAEAAAVRQGRDLYGQRLKEVEQALAAQMPQEPDWDSLEKEDPTKFATESARWARHQRKVDALAKEQQRVFDEQVADQQTQLEAFQAEQSQKLIAAIPEWQDAEVSKAEQNRLYDYAQSSLGFSDEEIKTILDHRAFVVMRKAMLFDELEAGGKKAQTKGKKTGTLKPGTRRRRRKTGSAKRTAASRQRLKQSGSVRDAEAALFDLLGDDA
jgi:hypothetical protein